MAPSRSRRLAGIGASPIRDIPSRKPRQQRAQSSIPSKSAPHSDSGSKSSKHSSTSSAAPFESLTPHETATNMSDASNKGKERPEEFKSEGSGQANYAQYRTSLEQYLANADPYRATSMLHPWPYPLALHHAPHLQKQILPLSNKIREALSSHGLPGSVEFLPYLVTKPQYPEGNTPINLLRVTLRAEHDVSIQLDTVKDDLLGLLRLKGIQNIHVEVVNIDLCFGPSIFPIMPQHPIVTIFENTKDQIIQVLNNNLGSKWTVLCPFRVGRSEQNARPTIVVHVNPLTPANWPNLVAQVENLTNPNSSQVIPFYFNRTGFPSLIG